MTEQAKKRALSKYPDGVACPGCGKTIEQDADLKEIEYVRTKRKTDIFFHRDCFGTIWHPEKKSALGSLITGIKAMIENEPAVYDVDKARSGWIPVEERLPENDDFVLLSFENFSLPMVGRYERDEDGGGSWYLGDCNEDDTCVANNLFVNAWQPLPEPYRETAEE